MTLPSKSKRLSREEILSIENAVNQTGITAVHPVKLEEWAEYLVERARVKEKSK